MRKTLVSSRAIVLGNKGENNVNKVLFPVRGWKELYGEGTFGLIHQRPNDNDPYPCSVTLNGYFVEWIIGAADVDQIGVGRCELRYMVGGTRVKSVVYDTIIRDSLGSNSIEPPDPWESWIDDLEQLAADIEATTETAFNTKMGEITAEATTLAPGSSATASFDSASKVMSFGIPRGADGSADGIWGQQNGKGAFYPSFIPGESNLGYATVVIAGVMTNLSMIEDRQGDGSRAQLLIIPNNHFLSVSAVAGTTSYTTTTTGYRDVYGTDVSMMASFKYAAFDSDHNNTYTEAKYPISVVQNNDGTLTLTFAESLNPTASTDMLTAGISLSSDTNGLIATGNGIFNNAAIAILGGVAIHNSGANSIVAGQAEKNTGLCAIVTGARNRNTGICAAVFGSNNLNAKNDALIAGEGHNSTSGPAGVAAVGKYSNIGATTMFAVGNGSDNTHRNNAMEVTSAGEIKENGTKLSAKYEAKGKATVSGTEYSITRKALAITENGVTTTYYVADIT